MNSYVDRSIIAGMYMAALSLASVAWAAEPGDNGSVAKSNDERSSIEKLVANQPVKPAASSIDAASGQPMTINFSDFVKEGAGCGVPNLETSSK